MQVVKNQGTAKSRFFFFKETSVGTSQMRVACAMTKLPTQNPWELSRLVVVASEGADKRLCRRSASTVPSDVSS